MFLEFCLCITAAVLVIIFFVRYIKLMHLYRDCRRLTDMYRGKLTKMRPLFLRALISLDGADLKLDFRSKDVFVKFVFIKQLTTLRFKNAGEVELIRYRRFVPVRVSRGKISAGGGFYGDITRKRKRKKLNFAFPQNAIGLLLFTNDPSEIQVYNRDSGRNELIGNGEWANGYCVGGYGFIGEYVNRGL